MHNEHDERNAQVERLLTKIRLEAGVARQYGQEANRLMIRSVLEFNQPDLMALIEYQWWAQWHLGQAESYLSAGEMVVWKLRTLVLSVEQAENLVEELEGHIANVGTQSEEVKFNLDLIRFYNPARKATR